MPYSITHLEIWNNKAKQLNIKNTELLDFLVWNIICDCSYDLKENWVSIWRDLTHYYKWLNYFSTDFPNNFFEKEIVWDEYNFLKLWYYYHLLVDKLWRDKGPLRTVEEEERWELRHIYQISRKIYAFYDYKEFVEKNWENLIKELYSYKIYKNINKLPSFMKDINIDIIQKVFLDILDYMTMKKSFLKAWNIMEKYVVIDDNKIKIENELKLKLNQNFSYENYKDLKEMAKNIDLQVFCLK